MSEKMNGLSMDIAAAEQEKLRAIFPECFVEGLLDERKLMELLGKFSTIDENDREKYEFRWKGKQDALKLAQQRSLGTLRPCLEESVNWEDTQNIYIEGDNLEVLKLLQTAYFRKVKMIYIDPPYNTGNDFVYADDFTDSLANYKAVTSQGTTSNPETAGRYHTNWLNMMYPRLRLAKNLLRDDGVIFISIDDGEQANIRKLCDEVFGEENFIANIMWQKRTSPDARKKISTGHEYVLMYIKDNHFTDEAFNLLTLSETDAANFKNPDNDPRGPWVSSDFTAQGYRPNQMYKIVTPGGAEYTPAEGRCWKNVESVFLQQLAEGRMWFGADGKGVPRRKTYLSERPGKNVWTWWTNKEVGHTQEATQELKSLFDKEAPLFDFSKPMRLIKRMVEIAANPNNNDIILDFFSGSATTAHAVMQLNTEDGGNRRFIIVQLPELCDEKSEAFKAGYKNICEIGKERIRRAGKKLIETDGQIQLGDEAKPPLDTGFRVFKLDTSNLKIWDNSPAQNGEEALQRMLGMLEILKPDRTDTDVVYEVMLKLGQDLCAPVLPIEINGKTVYGVADKDTNEILFIVCIAPHITVEDAEAMAEYVPGRIVFADLCFDTVTDASNVRLTLEGKSITIKVL